MNNASKSPKKHNISQPLSPIAAASQPYLDSCNEVELEAYNRILKNLQQTSISNEKDNILCKTQLEFQEDLDKRKKEKLKKELLQTTEYLKKQMLEKSELIKNQKITEISLENAQFQKMPANLVNVFPRITETPAEIRRSRELARKEELRKSLENQICEKDRSLANKKSESKNEEKQKLTRLAELVKKEENESKKIKKEKCDAYMEELNRDIKAKEIKKINEKRLENIEYEGMNKIVEMIKNGENNIEYPLPGDNEKLEKNEENMGKETENKEENLEEKKEEENIELIEKFFNENGSKENNEEKPRNDSNNKPKVISAEPLLNQSNLPITSPISPSAEPVNDRVLQLIAKKQKKANELLSRIENLEKTGFSHKSSLTLAQIQRLKSSLTPLAYKFNSEGKTTRLTGKEANKMIEESEENRTERSSVRSTKSRARSQADLFGKLRSSAGFGNTLQEKAQKVAYDRYISELEHQVFF